MADRRLKLDTVDVHGVYRGPAAGAAILDAFFGMRGHFNVEVTVGFVAKRPDELLVLVEIADVKAVFEPNELQWLGRNMIRGLPMARKLGATQLDEDELRAFAEMLIRNATEAMTISPHGLH